VSAANNTEDLVVASLKPVPRLWSYAASQEDGAKHIEHTNRYFRDNPERVPTSLPSCARPISVLLRQLIGRLLGSLRAKSPDRHPNASSEQWRTSPVHFPMPWRRHGATNYHRGRIARNAKHGPGTGRRYLPVGTVPIRPGVLMTFELPFPFGVAMALPPPGVVMVW
jgi:hypothetical protein